MELKIKPRNNNESTRAYVYDVLSDNIINLDLEPGCVVSEKEIADLLNVSRTPVREAFIQLSQEELVETYPQRGTYVSLIDMELVEESRFMRENLESAVVRLAAQDFPQELLFELESNLNIQGLCIKEENYMQLMKYDDKFHQILFSGTKKRRVWESVQRISAQFRRLRTFRLSVTTISEWENTYEDHKKILEAIRKKDPEEAERVMKAHLRKVNFYKTELQDKYPNYFK
ncbi:GntR family transcriptional regulator [Wukongibacter sp. M2B1]|uniref:GntR family transcriptional regulator n=1 Tax=Wukongibacter sp. M2B1 TaxID=3088895 RepID=UPI003D794178